MKKLTGTVIFVIAAVIFGIYGQSLAYFTEDMFKTNDGLYYLTAFTVLSYLLFIGSYAFIFSWMFAKSEHSKAGSLLFAVNSIIAVPVCLFSFFVTAMWWG